MLRHTGDEEEIKGCTLCKIVNAKASPHNHINTRSSSHILEIVHADTVGPIRYLYYSVSSERLFIVRPVTYYFNTLIDGYS